MCICIEEWSVGQNRYITVNVFVDASNAVCSPLCRNPMGIHAQTRKQENCLDFLLAKAFRKPPACMQQQNSITSEEFARSD